MNQSESISVVAPVGLIRRSMERILGFLTITRRLPQSSGGGRLVVNARVGGLKYLFKPSKSFDPELLRIASILVRPGDCVWDVGANVGLFSMASVFHSGSDGCVQAVEADQDAVSLLFRTARSVGLQLTVLPIAVSAHDGFVRFAIARRARASNAIEGFGSTQTGGVLEVRTLPTCRIDSLTAHFRLPAVLKIDVEGAEIVVLRGGSRLLREIRPRIYCEVTEHTRAEVVSILETANYAIFDGESYGTGQPRPVGVGTTNLVALPIDSEGRFS